MQRVQRPAVFLGSPYFYSDYPVEPVVQQAPSQVVVVQPPAAPEHAKDDVVQPLMIEWQGDHYASVSTAKGEAANTGHGSQDNTGASPKTLVASAKHPVQTKSAPAKAPLPPVVLVYRDGHREKIHDYTIVGGTIYARGDYWTDGYWKLDRRILEQENSTGRARSPRHRKSQPGRRCEVHPAILAK